MNVNQSQGNIVRHSPVVLTWVVKQADLAGPASGCVAADNEIMPELASAVDRLPLVSASALVCRYVEELDLLALALGGEFRRRARPLLCQPLPAKAATSA